MSVCVYASLCDFVCIALLLPFVLGFCWSFIFFFYFSIVFSTCYHWWICFLVWLLSSFFFYFIFFILNNIIFILITLLYFIFLSFFFSLLLWAGGWQGLGALAGCQVRASEVGELSSGHWSTTDLLAPRNIKWWKLTQRSPSQGEDPAPLNDQQTTVLDTLCQTTSKTGTQLHPLERLPKMIISSQTPQNIPPERVLPTRKTRSSLIHENTGTSPLHQEAYTAHWTNLSHRGEGTKNNGNCDLAACEKDTLNTVS